MIEDLRCLLGSVIFKHGDAAPIDDWFVKEIKESIKKAEFDVDE
jgi:hypothetical protein